MVKLLAEGKILLILLIMILIVTAVSAQDVDFDGVKDDFDSCPGTPHEDNLPIIRTNTEYLGCSCHQIEEMMGKNIECVDLYCFEGRILTITERSLSFNEINCEQDYCLGSKLYDFPEPEFLSCQQGELPEGFCNPTVTADSELCLYGEVGQKPKEQPPIEVVIGEELVIEVSNIDIIYDAILENAEIKEYLGSPNRKAFQRSVDYVEKKINADKKVTDKKVGGTEITIPFVSINITPKPNRELKNLVVFEHISNAEFERKDLIAFGEEPLAVTDEGIAIWKFEKVGEEGIIINYQVNEPMKLESETLVVAKVRGIFFLADWWPVLLIPIVGYFAFRYIISSKEK